MSKYTTEVRYICESLSGLRKSAGADSIDTILEGSWNKIFTSTVPFFDESYRKQLCKKILKHYYLREIGCETVGIWKLWMNTKLEEIMPYYNQLYKTELYKFDPISDVEESRTYTKNDVHKIDRTGSNTNHTSGSVSNENEGTNSSSDSGTTGNKRLYNDTPQGGLTGIESMTYLTNVTLDNGESSNTGTDSYNDTGSSSYTSDNTGSNTSTESGNNDTDYVESVVRKRGGDMYSDMVIKFRSTLLNIDMQVVREFKDLFMLIW